MSLCTGCNYIYAKKFDLSCSECRIDKCDKCLVKCHCGKIYCKDCENYCTKLTKCCGIQICKQCVAKYTCSMCNVEICPGCAIKLTCCQKIVCGNHKSYYNSCCAKDMCIPCHNKEEKFCSSCYKYRCLSKISICDVCNNKICNHCMKSHKLSHKEKCTKCKKSYVGEYKCKKDGQTLTTCLNCSIKCTQCNYVFCDKCGKDHVTLCVCEKLPCVDHVCEVRFFGFSELCIVCKTKHDCATSHCKHVCTFDCGKKINLRCTELNCHSNCIINVCEKSYDPYSVNIMNEIKKLQSFEICNRCLKLYCKNHFVHNH